MSITIIKTVNFGKSKTGLEGTVGYTLYNTNETEKQARTTSGVYELGTGTGIYACNITLDTDWNGTIFWDTGEATPSFAAEEYNHQNAGDIDQIESNTNRGIIP